MKKHLNTIHFLTSVLLLLFTIVLFSCNSNEKGKGQKSKKVQTKPIGNLNGQFYNLGPELDSASCNATGGCDCCAGHLLFLTNNRFIAVDYCLDNDVYYKGKYKIDKSTISFICDSLKIDKENNWEKWDAQKIDKSLPDFILKTRRDKTFDFQWTSFYFKNKLCFTTSFGDYSTPDNKNKKDFINRTKRDSIWKKLELE